MPIVASRKTGEILHMPDYTQEQRDRALEAVVKAFARRHPELLCPDSDQNAEGGKPNEP